MKTVLRKFGPYGEETYNRICAACDKPFVKGDYTTLIPLGPGDSEEDRKKKKEGRVYTAVAKEVHWACSTGEE